MKKNQVLNWSILSFIVIVLLFFWLAFADDNFNQNPYLESLKYLITGLAALGTFTLALMTYVNFKETKILEEKKYLGSVGIAMLKSGTIIIINNGKYPIKLISCAQKIECCKKIKWEYNHEGNPEISNIESEQAEKEYIQCLKKNKKKDWKGEMLLDSTLELAPKEQISLDDSLAYNLSESDSDKDYFATFIFIRLKWEDEKVREKKYIFRYSAYKAPQGWVRVG